MRLGYIRVSSIEQNIERQKQILKDYQIEKWFEEKKSAKDTDRPILKQLLEFARDGDEIYVSDYSRIARNLQDLLKIANKCSDENIKLISHKESFDTSTTTGKLMLSIMGAIYEFEREILLERQKEGIAIAKLKGTYKGRKPIIKPNNFDEIYTLWKNREITSKKAQELMNLKTNTFYKFINEERKKDN